MKLPLLLLPLLALPLHADEFDDLRLRWRGMLVAADVDETVPEVRSRLSALRSTAQGYLTSMDKSAGRRALWSDLASATASTQITGNWRRLRDMALAWATPGQSLYGDAELLATVRGGMDWMEANRYSARVVNKYDNWWDWEIGSPIEVGNLLVMLYDVLTPQEVAKHAAAVERFVGDPRTMIVSTVSTGANRVWKCKGALLRAIVARDAARLALASEALGPVFADVTSGDGFYADGSFIQHGRHPYTGGYGNSLIGELADVLYLLAGSRWEQADPKRDNIYRWVFESFEPLIYRGAMMDMVRGREISRSGSPDHAIGHASAAAILRVSMFAPPELAARMRSMLKEWYLGDTSRTWSTSRSVEQIMAIRRLLDDETVKPRGELLGSWVFAGMDRVVHLRPGWGLGIAMHSTRVYNYESINNENLRAWHSGDGMTFLYNSDLAQFSDAFWPTVDPQRLPGTTVVAGSTARQSQAGGSNVAGGATMYGYTAAMLRLMPDGRRLDAKKSWFLFDNEAVALGSDIRGTAEGEAVETIVENRLVRGESEFTRGEESTWAHLAAGDIGYYFPAETTWRDERRNRTGAWSDINRSGAATPITRAYQTIWFDHGTAPAGASYAYALLPGATRERTAAYAAEPEFSVVENSAEAQAVLEKTLGVRAVNFWTGPQTAAGITSDRIASVLVLQEYDGALHVAAADPTQQNTAGIRLEIDRTAGALVEKDEGIEVEQIAPTLKLLVRTQGARGRTLKARFAAPQEPAARELPQRGKATR